MGDGNAAAIKAAGPPSNIINYQGVQFNIADLLQQLRAKAKQVPIDRTTGQPSKYIVALEAIQNGTPPEQALAGASISAKNGKIILEKYNGYANYEQKKEVSPSTPLHLASISKVSTCIAILRLVDQKKILLDEDIRNFLPEIPYVNK